MADYTAGRLLVAVIPDLRGASKRIRREFSGLGPYEVPITARVDDRALDGLRVALRSLPDIVLDADATAADREIAALRARIMALSDQRVGIDVSAAAAKAEVDSIRVALDQLATSSPDIAVRVDASAAHSALTEVSAELDKVSARQATVTVTADTQRASIALRTLDTLRSGLDRARTVIRVVADVGAALSRLLAVQAAVAGFVDRPVRLRVSADTASAAAGIARMILLVTALTAGAGGLAGVLGGAAGALAGLGAAGAVAAGGLAATLLGFRGVGGAISALNAQEQSSIATARQTAAAQLQASRAADQLHRTRAEGARSVADAEKASARQVQSAIESVESAQRQYISAQREARAAQQALTAAWEAGRRSLQDLQDQLDMGRLDQRQAAYDLADARKALNEAMASGDADQIGRAQLAYDRQVETIDELDKRVGRLGTDNRKAQLAGVAGTTEYTAALERNRSAQDALVEAGRGVQRAEAAVDQARRDGAESVARAREQAAQQTAAAQQALSDALRAVADSGQSAGDTVTKAFSDLSPQAASFARYLFSLKPILDGLSATAAAGLFPPLQAGIALLVAQVPTLTRIVGQFGSAAGAALGQLLTELASPFWLSFFSLLARSAGTILPPLVTALLAVARAAALLLVALLPLAPAGTALLASLAPLITALAGPLALALSAMVPAAQAGVAALYPLGPVLVALSPILAALGVALAQVLGAALRALAPLLVALTPLLVAFAQSVAVNLVSSIQAATPFLVALAGWLSANPGLVFGALGAITALTGALGPLSVVAGFVLSALARFVILAVVAAGLRSLGLEATLLGRAVLLFLRPFSLASTVLSGAGSLAARLAGGPFALLRTVILGVGRAILTALGPVGILIAVLGLLYTSSAPFRDAVNALLGLVLQLAGQLLGSLMPVLNALSGVFGLVGGVAGMLAGQLGAALVPIVGLVASVLSQLVGAVLPPLVGLVGALVPVIVLFGQIFVQLLGALSPVIGMLAGLAATVLPPLVSLLASAVVPVVQFLAEVLAGVLVFAINNLVIPALKLIMWVITAVLVPAITWLAGIVVPIFLALGDAAMWLWDNAIRPAFDGIVLAAKVLAAVLFTVLVAPALIAWNLIAAGATWLWENALRPAFSAIGDFIGWVWSTLIRPPLDALVWLWTAVVAPAAMLLWAGVIRPIFSAIGAFIGWVWSTLIRPALDALVWFWTAVLAPAALLLWHGVIEPAFRGVGAVIDWVWQNVIRPAFDAVVTGLNWLGDNFSRVTDWIRDIWSRIRGYLAKPINFLINTVWNGGILPAWNAVASLVGLGPVAPLAMIPEAATGGAISTYVDSAGLIHGPGSGTSDSIMAQVAQTGTPLRVSAGEFIVRERIARQYAPFLSALNQGQAEALQAAGRPRTKIPRFAAGGDVAAITRARAYAGAQSGKSYQWGGVGNPSFDCSGFTSAITSVLLGRPVRRLGVAASNPWPGFAPGLQGAWSIGASRDHTAGTLAGINAESGGRHDDVRFGGPAVGSDAGQFPVKAWLPAIGGQYLSGGPGDGGGGGFFNWLVDLARSTFDTLTNPAIDALHSLVGDPPPEWRRAPVALATKARDTLRDFVVGRASAMGGDNGAPGSGPVVDQVRAVARGYGWDAGPQWDALSWLIQKESSWNPTNKNPGSTAYGLFQFLDSTWGTVGGSKTDNPGQQAVLGLRYIARRYRDPVGARAFHSGHGWYAQGGMVPARPFDTGGMAFGRGLMFKDVIGPERVLDPVETGHHDTLSRLVDALDAGRLVPAGGPDASRVDAMLADRLTASTGREVHLHVHGDVVDPVDVDTLWSRMDFAERGSHL